ncbi:ATP-binding protein [Streptomyces sp. N2-109]|uniref:ATP-binding protein n=1 Tax=Streptomyces gossypii TaxID=2883101 RepID=A0ABT2K407_9ACTN|nr:ATP-binding protein [Streptomyces gossypii]MCT2594349.1 ATP-binding protein [Streptomyces gossypii]
MAEHVQEAQPGYYVTGREHGVRAHLTASPANLRCVRQLTAKTLADAGVDGGTIENAQLVVSELCGNAVRACGDHVPLVVEVHTAPTGVWVKVHDPETVRMPRRAGVSMDDPAAESGRGLPLVDFLAPGWHTAITSVGKQVRCLLAYGG